MSASRRPVTGSGKRALVALAMGAITSPLLVLGAGPASAAVDITAACPEDAFEGAGFTDIGGVNAQFQLAINCLAALGITTGQTSTTFNPTGSITRAQFAQFLFRLGNLVEMDWDTSDAGFDDLGGVSAEARNAINALRNAGVVNGVTQDEYNPLGQVRRDQMATFLVQFYENVLGAPLPGTVEDAFTDDENNVHEANINAIAAADIADGVAVNLYAPNQPVTRAQMAAFVAREIQVAINEGLILPLFEEPAPEPTVAVDNQGNVTAGAELTGTFTDLPEDATVTVSGAGLTNQAVTIDANGAFRLALPANAPTGAQTLTFTITLADGTTLTVTADVTVAAQPSTTARPDLLTAAVVSTVAPGQTTPTSPAGTTVRYTFDENVTVVGDATVGNSAGAFNARLNDGTLLTGQFAATSATTVDVLFPTVTTTTGAGSAEDITLATVAFNAVTDTSGLANPEYDAPLGAATGGPITLPAGVTTAPDLISVGGFRQAANAGETAVDLTFDEAAFVTGAGQFSLVLTDATVLNATGVPAVRSTTTGGGTVAGGNGTTTLTVIFPTPGTAADRPPIAASAVARAVVTAGTVADQEQVENPPAAGAADPVEGVSNVRQAAQGAGGDTANPDLVSIRLQPSTTGGTDQALFTFDEAVDPAAINAGQFRLYTRQGTELTVDTPVSNPANRAQVLVNVPSTVTDVVGGSVDAGAVTTVAVAETTTTPGSPARPNRVDEEGVTNTATEAGRTPGRTALPDLAGVVINQAPADQFGNPGRFQATYTFDADVAEAPDGAATSPVPGEFFLYLGDGTRLQGTTLSTAARTEDTDNTVTVTGFQVLLVSGAVRADDPATTTVNEAVASQAEIQAAVLGTADAGAVVEQGGTASNPIGAERTTGGNGTLQ